MAAMVSPYAGPGRRDASAVSPAHADHSREIARQGSAFAGISTCRIIGSIHMGVLVGARATYAGLMSSSSPHRLLLRHAALVRTLAPSGYTSLRDSPVSERAVCSQLDEPTAKHRLCPVRAVRGLPRRKRKDFCSQGHGGPGRAFEGSSTGSDREVRGGLRGGPWRPTARFPPWARAHANISARE